MTATTAARVEVLTAEVRVLMVGSRQVTLSVYAQLDRAEPGQIEPFGRVRPGRAHCSDGWGGISRECPRDCIDVVGRDATGALVRSCTGAAGNAYCALRWRELPLIVLAGLR